jgi:hypothetical protein
MVLLKSKSQRQFLAKVILSDLLWLKFVCEIEGSQALQNQKRSIFRAVVESAKARNSLSARVESGNNAMPGSASRNLKFPSYLLVAHQFTDL